MSSVGYKNQCGSPPPPCTSFHARGTIDCSSGFSRFPNGSPYWMPTARRAAPPATRTTSAVRGPLHRASGPRGARTSLNLGRRLPDELGDVSCSDDHGVDSGAFERVYLLAARDGDLGDGKLARRHVPQELERATERVFLVGRGTAEQKDLRIEALERKLEFVLVTDLDDAVESELRRFR